MRIVRVLCVALGLLGVMACNELGEIISDNELGEIISDLGGDSSPITISSPTPKEQLTKVSLNETQKSYVSAGNSMAFRLLKELYDGKNMVCSPLSLQYALAMAANGAEGETLQQIIDLLGYGSDGIDALNEYSKILMEQLPAVDLDVTLKVTDGIIVKNEFSLLPAYKEKVENYYYAAVENMDFSNPKVIANRVNQWASKNTNGFIDKVLDESDISPETVALLMNALYFKAKWAGTDYEPMFMIEATGSEDFTTAGGQKLKMDMMHNVRYHRYAEMDGFTVLALPYAGGKFFMYFLLPEKNDINGLLAKMQTLSWNDVLSSFKQDAEVHVAIPKFDIEERYDLDKALKSMGMKKPFQAGAAEFDSMFANAKGYDFWIDKIIQKAKISVAEWGTEAAAVTVELMAGEAAPGEEPKRVFFYADHPFVFLIGEATSGTLLFEGVFSGK